MKDGYLYLIKKRIRKILEIKAIIKEWEYLTFPLGNKYYVIGTPEHSNVGDSAIAIAELLFLKRIIHNSARIKEISSNDVTKYHRLLEKRNDGTSYFFWHGGGNMGDLWFREEANRRKHIVGQYAVEPVIFPQTIYYSETPFGKKEREESIKIYNKPEITVIARETESYKIMKELYPEARILLTPDIVLSTSVKDYGVVPLARNGVLMVSRNDLEKSVEDLVWKELRSEFIWLGLSVRQTDMHSADLVTKENRMAVVRSKMQEFCGAQLVVTDRLHVMVFAAITGTACIVFSCNNHKSKGTDDWISYLDYIRFAETLEDAKTCIPDLLAMKNCKFDNSPLQPYFTELKEYIQHNLIVKGKPHRVR